MNEKSSIPIEVTNDSIEISIVIPVKNEEHNILVLVPALCNIFQNRKEKYEIVIINDYSDDNVSVKIVKIIQSYTKIINKFVWGK
jgi:glycosyltransferase involved in cell wall biosynthesis